MKPHLLEKEQSNWSRSALPVINLGPTPGTLSYQLMPKEFKEKNQSLEMQTLLWHDRVGEECFRGGKGCSPFFCRMK